MGESQVHGFLLHLMIEEFLCGFILGHYHLKSSKIASSLILLVIENMQFILILV